MPHSQKCRRCKIRIGVRESRKGGFWTNRPLCESCHRDDVLAKREEKAAKKAARDAPPAPRPSGRPGGSWGRLTD